MKAKYEVSIQQKDESREKLSEQIPLKTPYALQIETASACNFKCKFCMHGDPNLEKKSEFKNGVMKFSDFKIVIDQMTEFESSVKFLSLVARGEPLLNPMLPEMIQYAKDMKVAEKISINTNASLLNPNLNTRLIEAGLDVIRISIEGVSEQQYYDVSNVHIDFDNLVNNIRNLYENRKQCHIYVKIIDCNLSDIERKQFFNIFGNICDSIYIEEPVDMWKDANLDSQLFKKERYGQTIRKVKVCPRLFFSMIVHFDGTVVPCDLDWKEQFILGNVHETTMKRIWNGDKLNALRINHLLKQKYIMKFCNGCFNLENCSPMDDIDNNAESLLSFFTKAKEENINDD